MIDWLKSINLPLLWSLSLFPTVATQVLTPNFAKATSAKNMVWEVPFGRIISEQTVQVTAITEDHISAGRGGKMFVVPAPLYLWRETFQLTEFV